MIVLDSSGWQHLDVWAISNRTEMHAERVYNEDDCVNEHRLSFVLAEKEKEKLYSLLKHLHADCDEKTCKYCKERRCGQT